MTRQAPNVESQAMRERGTGGQSHGRPGGVRAAPGRRDVRGADTGIRRSASLGSAPFSM